MRFSKSVIAGMLVCAIFQFTAAAQTLPKFEATLDQVTVYRQGASLNHSATVNLGMGAHEILINNVAANLNEQSIQVGAPDGLVIMSVAVNKTIEANEPNKSPEYLKKEAALNAASNTLAKTQIQIVALEKSIAMLEQNQSIGGQNVGVNVAELSKMTDYYLAKQSELREKLLVQRENEVKQKELVQQLSAQLGSNVNSQSGGGQLRLQVMAAKPVQGSLQISYLSNAARWIAAYDLKAEKVTQPINLLYKANVYQSTGLEWKKVKLALSTGNPTQGGTMPILNTWFVRYFNPLPQSGYQRMETSMRKANTIQATSKGYMADDALAEVSSIGDYVQAQDNAVATTFNISLPYTIASNSLAHAVPLQDYKVPASFKYYAVPRLDPDAFLLAEIANFEQLNLVPGMANIIFENKYVGNTSINPYNTNDTLNLSMGRDKRIVLKREMVKDLSETKFIGSNKKQTFVYELSVRNGKAEAIELLLKDQIPVSTEQHIEVELLDKDGGSINEETGVVTWRLKLKAGETKKLRLSYSVKYPKDKQIGGL
jgi:uncharacterized protein (TIGR02231 family)